MHVKTINYALGSTNAFVLFLVDVTNEIVYYLPIQDYFIENRDKLAKVENNKNTVNVHISAYSTVTKDTADLVEIAKNVYVGGSSGNLRRICEEDG